ncbi:hypothetical protein Q3G72_008333 [Acer saccharum]|nr:hypothetical protein Q3G72_008333 [Acer saccharum]
MLDLSNNILSVLPSSIEELKLLCYLDLSRTEIEVLPNSICNLYNLQTLKLLGCHWFFKLPEDLGKLVNLRHLELDDIFWFKSSTLLPNLTSLQNLHAFQVGRKSGYGIEELKNMAYLTGTLHISKLENAVNAGDAKLNEKKNLDKLVFEWSIRGVHPQGLSDEETLLVDLQPHSNLTELQILNYMGNNFPNWIAGGQLQNLQTLTLNGCTGCKILSFAQIPCLHTLNIKRMPELEKWSDRTCLSLYRLKISCCEKLSELPQHFFNLGVMKIKRCHSLKSLPVTPSLEFLILDDNPVLEDLNEQAMLVITQSDQGHNITEPKPTFSDLLEMKIINCPKLQALPEFFAPQKREISVLKSLGTKGTLKSLNSLKDLQIEDCPSLLSFPEDGLPNSLQHLRIQDCPSLTQQCGTEDVQGPEWTKISHIPDWETDFIRSQNPPKKAHSATWYRPFCCSRGE